MKAPVLDFKRLQKLAENKTQLKYILPYSFIMDNGICILKNGALMTTYQVEYPDLESSSAGTIASVASLLNSSIMSVAQEEGWAVFFECKRYKTREYPTGQFDNLAGWLIDQKRADNYSEHGEHFTSDYFITFCYQLPSDIEQKATSFLFKSEKKSKKKSLFGNSNNLPIIRKEIENFLEETEKVMGALGTKIWYMRLNNPQLFSHLKNAISIEQNEYIYPENTFFFLDNYLVDNDIETTIPLKNGDYYTPILAVMDFPSSTYPAIFDRLNRTMTEFVWTTRFLPLSKEKSAKKAEEYQKRMYSARKSFGTIFAEMATDVSIDRENNGALAMEGEANQIQADIAMGSYVLGYYTSNIMVWDKDLDLAKEKSRKLQQVVRSCGFSVKEEGFNNMDAWLGMLPGNIYSNVRQPVMTSLNASHLFPLSSAWQGQMWNEQLDEWCGSGVPLCICSTSYGTPFFLNLNVKDVGNAFIFGPVGSGKSTLLALLMAQATKYKDVNIICIDKQLSSRAFIVAGGGVYVEPGKDEVAFQPLSELLNPNETDNERYIESLMWCQQFIEGLLVQQNIEITASMSKAINETLRILSEKDVSQKNLTSFQGYINFTDTKTGENTIRDGIEPYTKGGVFGSIFDASETTLDLSKLMTIEMGSLMRLSEKAVAPALMYIFRYLEKIWNVGHGEKQPVTYLFLDEAWLYLQHPMFASYLQEWLRTLRKKRVFCIFATQEVSAAANSPLKDTIIQQCKTRIYLADENAVSLSESYKEFGLTDSEIIALSNAIMKRDYFFKNPLGSRMFSLDLDDFQLALISSDHELLDKLEDKYGKNTGYPLAFELLDYTKEKYKSIGKDYKKLDYSKYKKILENVANEREGESE